MESICKVINSYIVCPRQAWLDVHIMTGNKDNIFFREGLLPFLEEKKREEFFEEDKVKQELIEIEAVISQEKPPKARWVGGCSHCSYCESCYV